MSKKLNVIFVCTGNSCRSQMAEGWAHHFHSDTIEPFSAGLSPRPVDPVAVQVMAEAGVDISKQQQSSDWGAETLTQAQIDYAASDVLYLHQLREVLNGMLEREGRMETAQACFDFLPMRAKLDLMGWPETDIFAHS